MRKQNDKRKIEVRRAEDIQTGQKSRQSGCTRNTNLGGGEKISFLEEVLEASSEYLSTQATQAGYVRLQTSKQFFITSPGIIFNNTMLINQNYRATQRSSTPIAALYRFVLTKFW
jgi:hypothetical protein